VYSPLLKEVAVARIEEWHRQAERYRAGQRGSGDSPSKATKANVSGSWLRKFMITAALSLVIALGVARGAVAQTAHRDSNVSNKGGILQQVLCRPDTVRGQLLAPPDFDCYPWTWDCRHLLVPFSKVDLGVEPIRCLLGEPLK
jgi:hypothetical protein